MTLQREFFSWLGEPQFSVPLEPYRQDKDSVELRFPTLGSDAIVARLDQNGEIDVAVHWEGNTWDFLYWGDYVEPKPEPGGWFCAACEEVSAQRGQRAERYATLPALWRDHSFEPFREWVNTKLAQSDTLGLARIEGMSWAVLLPADGHRGRDSGKLTEWIEVPLHRALGGPMRGRVGPGLGSGLARPPLKPWT